MLSFTRSGKKFSSSLNRKKRHIQAPLELVEKNDQICSKLNQLFEVREDKEMETHFHETISAFYIATTKRQIHVYIKFNMQAVHP